TRPHNPLRPRRPPPLLPTHGRPHNTPPPHSPPIPLRLPPHPHRSRGHTIRVIGRDAHGARVDE
ncbi:MAG: hypothetical protein Q9180_006620, partial [Flavoplaca navasiana]